jgi:hypothetical protein
MGMEYEVYDWKEAHYYYVYGENSVLSTSGLQYNSAAQTQVDRIKNPLQSGWNSFTVDETRFKNLSLPAFPPGM